MNANNAYRSYRPAPPSTVAAQAVAAKLPGILTSIRAHPPITERSVSSALNAAFPYPAYEVEVSKDAARIPGGIGYGIYVQGACVHGWVMADGQGVAVDGLSGDGGCLPLLGH
jgi:hypothetical protein